MNFTQRKYREGKVVAYTHKLIIMKMNTQVCIYQVTKIGIKIGVPNF